MNTKRRIKQSATLKSLYVNDIINKCFTGRFNLWHDRWLTKVLNEKTKEKFNMSGNVAIQAWRRFNETMAMLARVGWFPKQSVGGSRRCWWINLKCKRAHSITSRSDLMERRLRMTNTLLAEWPQIVGRAIYSLGLRRRHCAMAASIVTADVTTSKLN